MSHFVKILFWLGISVALLTVLLGIIVSVHLQSIWPVVIVVPACAVITGSSFLLWLLSIGAQRAEARPTGVAANLFQGVHISEEK